MEKGIAKTWTPEQEELWARRLRGCRTFAGRHLTMNIRDLLKYDGRTKEGKRAVAQGRLRVATATDDELVEIARLEVSVKDGGGIEALPERAERLAQLRARLRQRGVKKEDLVCR